MAKKRYADGTVVDLIPTDVSSADSNDGFDVIYVPVDGIIVYNPVDKPNIERTVPLLAGWHPIAGTSIKVATTFTVDELFRGQIAKGD